MNHQSAFQKSMKGPADVAARRGGVTLVEVLMSILIMGVGVVSVAALFPLAVVRSIQASQLTNATLLRYNAEAAIDILPGLVHDPDGDGNLLEHFQAPAGRNYIVDPRGYYVHLQDGANQNLTNASAIHGWFGNDGTSVGSALSIPRMDGGYHFSLGGSTSIKGHQLRGLSTAEMAGGENWAASIASSQDGWLDHVDTDAAVLNATTRTSVTMPAGTDLSTLISSGGSPNIVSGARITIFNDEAVGEASVSQTYPITSYNGLVVSWSEDLDNDGSLDSGEDLNGNGGLDVRTLPSTFTGISRVIIETTKSRLYSWMLTVRKGPGGQASVDVVVVFNRAVDPANEQLFTAQFVPGGNVLVKQNNSDGTVRDEPFIKKGGFVFDVVNARWYRVEGVDKKPLIGTWAYGAYDFALRVEGGVDRLAGEDADADGVLDAGEDDNGNGILDLTAMFMPGVVEVFPIGSKSLPEVTP